MRTKKAKRNAAQVCSKRHRQFELARKKVYRTPRDFYIMAAGAASPRVSVELALNDYGRHQLSLTQGKFTAPPYVHAYIDSILGLTPKQKEAKTDKPLRRKRRQKFAPRREQPPIELRA